MTTYEMDNLRSERARKDQPYLEFLRAESMSAGIYVLGPGEQDMQEPHRQDELYFVVRGEGRITVADEDAEVRTGSTIFVAANVPHHFHSIGRELTLLVFFAPPEST
jgi:mannose-6-phosphate isomerase-like protein (cupin superfamily)